MSSYAVRGGRSVKIRLQAVAKTLRTKSKCPRCEKKSLKRTGTGIWSCKSCKNVFAGGAYALTTPGGEVGTRIVSDLKNKR
jgi:large subunit ribosomal protein L37Ae